MGVKIKGLLVAMDEKVGEYDGVKKVTYRYHLVVGMESYIVTSDQDYREMFQIGDTICFLIDVRAYGGKAYFTKGLYVNE